MKRLIRKPIEARPMLPHLRTPHAVSKQNNVKKLLELQKDTQEPQAGKAAWTVPSGSADCEQPPPLPATRWHTVVVADPVRGLCCPECELYFEDDVELQGHIFQCRLDHGVDPLLPLHILKRDRREAALGVGGSRHATSARGARRLTELDAPTMGRYLGQGPTMGSLQQAQRRDDNLLDAKLLRSVEEGDSIHCEGVVPASIADRRLPRQPANRRQARANSARSDRAATAVYGGGDHRPRSPPKAGTTGWVDHVKKIASGHSPVRQAHEYRKISQACARAAARQLLNDKSSPTLTLDLSGMHLQCTDAAEIASMMRPHRSVEVPPIQVVDLRGTTFDHAKADAAVLDALATHPHVCSVLISDSTVWGHPATAALLVDAVQERCRANVIRNRRRACDDRLAALADAFKRWEKQKEDARTDVASAHQKGAQAIAAEQSEERDALCSDMATIVNAQLVHERRLRVRERKQHQRLGVIDAELRERGRIEAAYYTVLLFACEHTEEQVRRHHVAVRDHRRGFLRIDEREHVFRAKLQETQRLEREVMERLQIERALEGRMQLVLSESTAALEMMSKQKARHRAYAVWKRRQRDEVDQLQKQERVARETIEREEEGYFVSGREKLTRTIESIFARYAAQRESVESGEENVREVLEMGLVTWWQTSQAIFESEARLILLWTSAVPREAARRSVLQVAPALTLEYSPATSGPSLLPYCAATPAHSSPDPVPLFSPSLQVKLSMPPDWTHKLHDVMQKCRRSLQDEQTAFGEHTQVLQRFARLNKDSHALVFGTSLEELRMRYMQPLTRMQQIMNPTIAASQSQQRAAYTPPFGNWADELAGSLSGRSRSKRKFSVAPTPLEPVTDAAFVELAAQAFKWRVAWSDKLTPQQIRNAKECILHGQVELTIDDPPTSPKRGDSKRDDVCITEHRLVCKSSRPYFIDDVLHCPQEAPDEALLQSSGVDDTTQDDDGRLMASGDDGEPASVKQTPPRPTASRSVRIELKPTTGEAATSDASSDSGAAHAVTAVSAADVGAELHSMLYQCVVDGAAFQQCGLSVSTAKIDFCVSVSVAMLDSYTGSADAAPDVFGYAPLAPDPNRRTVALEVRGSVLVGVTPSYFTLVPPDTLALQVPRVLVEKQMDEIVVFPTLHRIDGPKEVMRSRVNSTLITSDYLPGFAGGTLTVEVVGGSPSDRLSIRDDLPAFKLECHDKTKAVKALYLNGCCFAEVVDGAVQSCKFVTPANSLTVAPFVSFAIRDKSAPSSRIGPDAIKFLLQRLRFHNFDDGPVEGRRVVRVTLSSALGARSVLEALFDIERIDEPTDLRIAYPKVTHRAPYFSCPSQLRANLCSFFVPVFPNVVVADADTDRFSGGHLKLTVVGGGKGDTLVFVPDTRVLNHIDNVLDTVPILKVVNQNEILFEDRVVASVTEGSIALDVEWMDSSNGEEDEKCCLLFDFAGDDMCSIKAVQAILRHVAFFTNPGLKLPHNANAQRDVTVELQIQDNEQPTFIEQSIQVKSAGHCVQLPDKAAVIDFKEGSPPIKLGNFDIGTDKTKPITTFSGAYILAYVADGYTDGDVIGLKPDDLEYRVVEPKKPQPPSGSKPPVKAHGRATALVKEKAKQLGTERVMERSMSTSNLTTSAVATSVTASGPSIADVAATFAAARMNRVKQDLLFSGMSGPMATMQTTSCGGILITFLKDTKKDSITKKQVLTMLRSLTFFTPPNPTVGFKVIRVLFSDEPATSPSQVLVGVRLEYVDDVTEIRMKSPRKQCLQQPIANFPLCPYGRCVLVDEDTDFLDGGAFLVQCVAGSSKGDTLAVVTPSRQAQLPLQREAPPVDGFVGAAFPELIYSDEDRTFWYQQREVGRVDTTVRDGGVAELRISFSKDGTGKLVPLHVASYMMNSIVYGNNTDKLRDASRQFQLRIKDASNPVEGKMKLQLELLPPHMVFATGAAPPQSPGALSISGSAQPSTQDLFTSKLPIGCSVGSTCMPGSRIVVQCDTLHENKSIGGTPGGSIIATGPQAARVQLLVAATFFEEFGLVRRENGDVFTSSDQKHFVLRLLFPSPTEVQFSFTPQHPSGLKIKPVTKGVVQALLRAVVVTVCETLDATARRRSVSVERLAEAAELIAQRDRVSSCTPTSSHQNAGGTPQNDDFAPPPLNIDPLPELTIDGEQHHQRSSLSVPVISPGSKSVGGRSPRATPLRRSSRSPAPADDDVDDDSSFSVHWRLHDGKHLSLLTTAVVSKR